MIGPATGVSLLTLKTAKGKFVVARPDKEAVERTKKIAKQIFIEAFTTTYTEYYRNSGDKRPIEVWLGKKEGYTIDQWLSDTFDGEYEEYLEGKKVFIHLYDEKEALVGWLSHSPVSETGEMYLSQCSLEAESRGHRVAADAFAEALQKENYEKLFPGVKVVKLIAREINKIAEKLYLRAGFTKDITIDPKIYGETYGPLYVGYRKEL